MAEKCATPECLRGVDDLGDSCIPCQKGFPPMKNPKSPHAWNNTASKKPGVSGTPKHGNKPPNTPKKKEITVEEGGKIQVMPDKTIIMTDKKGYKTKFKEHERIQAEIKQIQRKAVELIFASYWYGWPDGIPEAFTEIFKDYGVFATGREVPSQMVGSPQVHKSQVNVKGHPSFVLVMEVIYPIQGEASTFREIERSPVMMDALNGVSPTHAIEMIKNHGKTFTFQKVGGTVTDGSVYKYIDDTGTTRMIPRWAIA